MSTPFLHIIDEADVAFGKARAILRAVMAADEADFEGDMSYAYIVIDEYIERGMKVYEAGIRNLANLKEATP